MVHESYQDFVAWKCFNLFHAKRRGPMNKMQVAVLATGAIFLLGTASSQVGGRKATSDRSGSILVLVVLAVFGQVGGRKTTPDQRVEKLLKEAGLKYEIDEDGDFVLGNQIDAKRTQLAWIMSRTSQLGHLEIREIWSIGYRSKGPIPAKIAARLLEQNGQVKLGAWHIRKMGEYNVAVFAAQIAADTDATTLLLALHAVTTTADEMEKELTGKDEF